VEVNFKNVMNESEIALVNERSEDERFKVWDITKFIMTNQTLHLILENLHLQGISCKPHGRNYLSWTFYYVNDGSKMNVNASQLICCMVCCNNQLKDKVEEGFGILFQEQ
jgi:hypothetical protein